MFDRYGEVDNEDEFRIPALDMARRRAPGNRRLAVIATGIGVALLAVGGGLELTSHRSTVVPVLAADSRPIRVRPENPGGMQVIGASENLAADAAAGAETLTPPPEAPDTRALHAQQEAEESAHALAASGGPVPPTASLLRPGDAAPDVPLPPQITAAVQEAPPSVPPVAAPVTRVEPVVRAPASMPAPAKAAAPAHAAAAAPQDPAASPAGGGRVVQLAAVSSQEAATAEWDRLARRMPDLLGGRRPEIVRFERDGHVFFRLRTAGFSDSATAAAFCERVRAKGAGCAVF